MNFRIVRSIILLFVMLPMLTTKALAETDLTVYATTVGGNLISFAHDQPDTIKTTVALSGLQGGETILGMDFRPATDQLYLVGSTSRLYTVDTSTGVVSEVGSVPFSVTLSGATGIDFNPVADRLRVVTASDQNVRLNPNTGAVAAQDTTLAYETNDANFGANPNINAVGYVNNSSATTVTTLLGIDSSQGILVRIGGPNNESPSVNTGTVYSLGSLGIGTGFTNAGLDTAIAKSNSSQLGLLVATLSSETESKLYAVDLAGGAASLIGTIAAGEIVTDIAISTADLVAPQVLISGADSRKIKALKNSGYSLNYSGSEDGSITAELSVNRKIAKKLGLTLADQVVIGTGSGSIDDAGRDTLTISLSAEALSGLNSKKGRKIESFTGTVTATFTDSAGNSDADTFTVKFER